jgi:WD40 repeat protein
LESNTFSPISAVRFSYFRPTVFIAGSKDGFVYVFDMLVSSSAPVSILQLPPYSVTEPNISSNKKSAHTLSSHGRVTSIAFSRKQRDLVAVSDHFGRIHIWRLGWDLSNKKPGEETFLRNLANIQESDDV